MGDRFQPIRDELCRYPELPRFTLSRGTVTDLVEALATTEAALASTEQERDSALAAMDAAKAKVDATEAALAESRGALEEIEKERDKLQATVDLWAPTIDALRHPTSGTIGRVVIREAPHEST